jgi:hypothetical protein
VNCSQIQTYIINSARVVFLNERPHPRGKNGEHKKASQQSAANGGACKHCLRTLQADSVSFCSIACKAIGGGDMQPNAESMRLLEETVMKQHVAIPRNSQNKSNNNSNNNYNNLQQQQQQQQRRRRSRRWWSTNDEFANVQQWWCEHQRPNNKS